MTAALLPPAGGGASLAPLQVIPNTAPALPLRVLLPPAGGAGSGLPLSAPAGVAVAFAPASAVASGLPLAVVAALPAPQPPPLPAWQRDVEGWAVARQRLDHVQAMWQYGELACFALAWHVEDLRAGLTQRCYRCWQGDSDSAQMTAEQLIAQAYGQGNQYRCPVCYNTTFALPEGTSPLPGLRALIVRPALWSEFDRAQTWQARGVYDSASVNVESTPDFRVRAGDWALRADGTRFALRAPRRVTLRTGFATPWQASAAIDYNMMNASLEDRQSSAYLIEVPDGLASLLGTYTRVPADYAWAETVNAPLIPLENPSPASSGRPQPPASFPPGRALYSPSGPSGTV
jgi:hypothetical protein